MPQPKTTIIVKTGVDRLTLFDVTHNITGYVFVDLIKQEFTFDFDPLKETTNIIDACLTEKRSRK